MLNLKDNSQEKYSNTRIYTSPYLTCLECNAITFVDTVSFKYGVLSRERLDKVVQTNDTIIGECPTCGEGSRLATGACNANNFMKEDKKLRKIETWVQTIMAKIIQRAYRFYLDRLFARSRRRVVIVRNLLYHRAAAIIQSLARMRFAIRKQKIEKAIKIIKYSPIHLLLQATDKRLYETETFWFETVEESNMLFIDYDTLIERVGHHYERGEVERNVLLIAQRILDKAALLATRIQAQIRKLMAKFFFIRYRRDIVARYEAIVNNAIIVQRVYRGLLGRRRILQRKSDQRNKLLLNRYLQERSIEAAQNKAKEKKENLKWLYLQEQRELKLARYMGGSTYDNSICHKAVNEYLSAFRHSMQLKGEGNHMISSLKKKNESTHFHRFREYNNFISNKAKANTIILSSCLHEA